MLMIDGLDQQTLGRFAGNDGRPRVSSFQNRGAAIQPQAR